MEPPTGRGIGGAAVAATLGSILEAGDDVVRCAAVECLEHLLPGPAEDLLIGCLTDPDVDVRILAARALGAATSSDRVGAALLQSVIADPSGEVKELAIRSIARLGYRGDLAPLRRLAVDRDLDMAWDEDDGAGEWDQWLDVQVAAIEALGHLGDAEAVPAIVAALDDEVGQDVEPQAFAALAHLDRPGIEALAQRLERGSARSRRRAASALAQSTDPAAVPIQKSLANSQDPEIRRAAAVRVMADDAAGASIATFSRDPDPAIRREAVKRAPADQVAQVVGLAGDADENVWLAVVEAVSAQTPEVLAVVAGMLRDRLNDTSDGVAAAAATALGGITDDLTRRSLHDVAEDRTRAPSVRAAAVGAIGGAGDRESLDALTAYADDSDHLVRFSALLGLCNAAAQSGPLGEASLELLLLHLAEPPEPESDPTPEADGVAEISPPKSPLPPQQQQSGEMSTLQAIERANLAPQVAAPASPPMVCELDDDEARFLSLAENMPRRTKPNLTPDVPIAADRRRAVARLMVDVRGADVVDGLVGVLAAQDLELRLAAAATLSQHPDLALWARQAGSMELLISLAMALDPNLRVFAARILARLAEATDDASSAEAIDRLLDDPVPAVVREAFTVAGNTDHARERASAVLASADTLTGAAALGWMVRTGEPGALAAAVDFALSREGWDPVRLAEILPEADWPEAVDHLARIAGSAANPLATVAALNAIKSLAGP